MTALIFSIEPEIRNQEVFLAVRLSQPGSSKILYLDTLKKLAKEAPELSSFLIKEHCKQSRISPLSHQADTLSCNVILIPADRSLEAIKWLVLSKKLLWKGRPLFFNPYAKAKISWVAEEMEEGALLLSGRLHLDGRESCMSDGFFFPGKPVWGIQDQIVFSLPDVSWKWIQKVYPVEQRLEGKKKDEFIELYKEDADGGFLSIEWKGHFSEKQQEQDQILPFLVLKDRHGAFADLWMDHGVHGKVNFHDSQKRQARSLEVEQSWEKDLLETDFIRKTMEGSHYYCPMDRVAKSLAFLLEIGWKIYDWKGRQILKMTDMDVRFEGKENGILIRGGLKYDQYEADIRSVVGAFNRREKFLELSPQTVALLEPHTWEESLQDLSSAEIVQDSLLMRKKNCGLLGDLFRKKQVLCDEAAASLMERLQSAKGWDARLPGPCFHAQLYPYQQEGLNWLHFLHQTGFSGLLADEMGLGKTVQVLAFFSTFSTDTPILLVVPTSLVFNWKREWEKFLPGKSLYIHEGRDRSRQISDLQGKEAVLTSYACLRMDQELFSKVSFSCVILDEAQSIKNPDSQIAEAAFSLQAFMKVCLTGTPIENKAEDLWSLFHFLEPELLGERKAFQASAAAATADQRHLQEIKKKVRPFILRRLKEEVAQDLPEKIEQEIWIELEESQRSFYEDWMVKTRQGLLKKVSLDGMAAHRMEILETILRLRQICCHPLLVDGQAAHLESAKLNRLLIDLEEVIKQGRKALIYSQFTQMLQLIKKEVEVRNWKYAYLDGSTQRREEAVLQFQEDPGTQLFLISLKAGGVGLNLTAADYVFLFDPWWNEAAEKQAIDRAHRFGRKTAVVARRYITVQSIEEKIMKLKAHKTALAQGFLEFEEGFSELGLADLFELLQ
jgi:superfamily II DNA or RNA helicase